MLVLFASTMAQAQSDAFQRGQAAEDVFDPRAAIDAYRQVVQDAPTSRLASRARRRIEWLEARSEDEFRPLVLLMRAQSETASRSIVALEDAMTSFPEGRVRREAHEVVAHGWAQLGETERALTAYRRWKDDSHVPEADRARATTGLARLLQTEDRTDEAIALLNAEAMSDTPVAADVRAAQRRASFSWVAMGVIAAFFVVLVALLRFRWLGTEALRAVFRPVPILLGLYLLGVPWGVAVLYDESAADTFRTLTLGLVPLLVVALAAAHVLNAEQAPRRKRAALAAACVGAQVAVGYLVLVNAGQTVLGLPV